MNGRVAYETWIPASKAGRLRWFNALLLYGGKLDAGHKISFGPGSDIKCLVWLQPKHVEFFKKDVGAGVELYYRSPTRFDNGSLVPIYKTPVPIYKTPEEELAAQERDHEHS